jgi:hypothetical protein
MVLANIGRGDRGQQQFTDDPIYQMLLSLQHNAQPQQQAAAADAQTCKNQFGPSSPNRNQHTNEAVRICKYTFARRCGKERIARIHKNANFRLQRAALLHLRDGHSGNIAGHFLPRLLRDAVALKLLGSKTYKSVPAMPPASSLIVFFT